MAHPPPNRVIGRIVGDLPPQVAVLAAVAFAVAVGFGIVAPVLPIFVSEFGVGKAAVGAVVSVFAFMRLSSSLAGGRLVERFGERLVVATGLGIVAVTSLLTALAQSYVQLLVFRGLGGIGSAMFTVAAVTLLLRLVGPHQRGRANAWFQGGFLMGGLAGPLAGGLLAGISVRMPFFVYSAALAVACAITLLALRHAPVRSDVGGGSAQGTGLMRALRHPAYRAALVANLGTGWMLFGVRSSLVPLFVADTLGRGPAWVGVGFLVGSAAQAAALWPAGRVVDRIGRKPAVIGGGVVAVAAVGLLVVWQSVPGFLASMALYGIAAAFLGVSTGAVVGDVVEGRGGTVVAAYQMSGDLGAILGPLLAGWLADEAGYGPAFMSGCVVIAIGVLLALPMPETRDARPPATALE